MPQIINFLRGIAEWTMNAAGRLKRMVRRVLMGQITAIMKVFFAILGMSALITGCRLVKEFLTKQLFTKNKNELYDDIMKTGMISLLFTIFKFYTVIVIIKRQILGDPGLEGNNGQNGDDADDQNNQGIPIEQIREIQEVHLAQEGENQDNQRQVQQEPDILEVPQDQDVQLEQGGLPDPIGQELTRPGIRQRQSVQSTESTQRHQRSRSDDSTPGQSAARGKESMQKHPQDVQAGQKETSKQKEGVQREQSVFARPGIVASTPSRYALRTRDKGAIPTSELKSTPRLST